ncbi:hypothetical protein GRC12_12285 [Streptomyces griseorubiginosus]|nr:hypothetical protein [Streptomyces griseorubiginosus]
MADLLTVGDLVGMPTLGQTVLAGADGLDHVVLWAHSCEMPDPWSWLGPDELLMTVGLCLPTSSKDQVALIEHLKRAQLSGMTVGDDQMAPPLTPEMFAAANRLGFPILLTDHSVPFITVGRTVALANEAGQAQQLLQISRLYRALNSVPSNPAEAIAAMENTFGIRMAVADRVTGALILPGALDPSPETVRALSRPAKEREATNLGDESGSARKTKAWELAAVRSSVLLVEESGSRMLDAFALTHLKQAVTVAVNNLHTTYMLTVAQGEHLTSLVLAGQMPIDVLAEQCQELGLTEDAMVVIAAATDKPNDLLTVLHAAGVAHLPRRTPAQLICCVGHSAVDAAVSAVKPLAQAVGVSEPFSALTDLGRAIDKAVWALAAAPRQPDGVAKYEQVRGSVLPRDNETAHEIIETVLGPLISADARNGRLLITLIRFLANDRSWTATAEELNIHRQSLGYRLRQIESATGRSLKDSRDIAELWVAVTAWSIFRDKRPSRSTG